MIPSGQEDISLFLEICDRIRSKEVPAKDAMRSLKKRLQHKNPNVQLLALKLTDVCVKNGGAGFLAEVASREFMDTLIQIVNNNATNNEVKNKILSHVQSWANAFKSKPNLSYAVDAYNSLKSQGHQFPASATKTDAIMIDTQQAPEWCDSEVCERCRTLFTLTNRKHHCRNCGKTYCNQCSRNNIALPHFGIYNEVRVCDGCFATVTGGRASEPVTPVAQSFGGSGPSKTSEAMKEEEELQRAIALSLLEADKSSGKKSTVTSSPGKQKQSEEQDPELAAAIAASLKEVQIKDEPPRVATVYPTHAPASSSARSQAAPVAVSTPAPAAAPVQPSQKIIGPVEMQNISLFYQLMDKMDADTTGSASAGLLQDREMKTLHELMTQLHPKIVKEIEECVEKHRQMMDMHEKLTSAVRVYDRLYEEKLVQQRQEQAALTAQQSIAYNQYPPAGAYGYVQPQAQPYYHPQSFYGGSPAPASYTGTSPQQGYAQYAPQQQQQQSPSQVPYQQPPAQGYAPQQPAPAPTQQYPYGPAQHAYPPQQAAPQHAPQQQQQQPPVQQQKPLIEF